MRDLLKVLKAAADRNRLRILKMLQQKQMCVCELAAVLGITQPSVSKHLSLLKEAGLVSDERDGQWINYRLSDEAINQYGPALLELLQSWVNDDTTVSADVKKSRGLCREQICKKNERSTGHDRRNRKKTVVS